ncbi:MAG: PAS domain S-box protein [Desulfonatronovibrionaceae bacterium]
MDYTDGPAAHPGNPDKVRLNMVFDHLPFVLIVLDIEGIVRSWNSMAEILFNIRGNEAMDRPFSELANRLDWTEVMQSVDNTFKDSGFENMHKEVRYRRNDGSSGFMDMRVLN